MSDWPEIQKAQVKMFDQQKKQHIQLVDKIMYERPMIELLAEHDLYDSTGAKLKAFIKRSSND